MGDRKKRRKGSAEDGGPSSPRANQPSSKGGGGGPEPSRFALWYRSNRRDIRFLAMFCFCLVLFYLGAQTSLVKNRFFPSYLAWNARTAAVMVRAVGEDATAEGQSIVSARGPSIQVERGCDAVEPSALLVAAVLASPVVWWSRILAAVAGTAILMVLNLVRVASLFWVRIFFPEAFDTMHLDVWQALFIFAAIVLWAAWASRASRRQTVQIDAPT